MTFIIIGGIANWCESGADQTFLTMEAPLEILSACRRTILRGIRKIWSYGKFTKPIGKEPIAASMEAANLSYFEQVHFAFKKPYPMSYYSYIIYENNKVFKWSNTVDNWLIGLSINRISLSVCCLQAACHKLSSRHFARGELLKNF